MTSIEVTGKTIEEAIKSGLAKLQRKEQDVLTEVITEPSSGIFGFGKRDAKVRLTVIEKEITPDTLTEAVMTESVAEPKEMTVKKKEETSAENIATEGKELLQEVLEKMGISVVIEKMIKEDKIILHLHGKDLGVLIGKHGQTLDALQYLVNLKANKDRENHCFVMLDVENYRTRREETLKALAHRLASRVKHNHDKMVLEPMNGYERKIIHVALQHTEHIRTESEGQEPYRHVVIYYQ